MKLNDGYSKKLSAIISPRRIIDSFKYRSLIIQFFIGIFYIIIVVVSFCIFAIIAILSKKGEYRPLLRKLVLAQQENNLIPEGLFKESLDYVNAYKYNSYIIIKEMYALLSIMMDKPKELIELTESIEKEFSYMPKNNISKMGIHEIY